MTVCTEFWGCDPIEEGGGEISVGCNSHISTIVPTRPGLHWPQQWFMVEATCNNSCIITLWPIKRSFSSLGRHWPRIKPDLELDSRRKAFLPVLAGSAHAHAKDTVITCMVIGKCSLAHLSHFCLTEERMQMKISQSKITVLESRLLMVVLFETLDGGLIWDSWCWSSLRRITICIWKIA